MAEAVVSAILEQIASIAFEKGRERVQLVANVKVHVDTLTSNLKAIQSVLEDAEEQQVANKGIRQWLDKLKDVAYDIEDVLDEWNAALLKLSAKQAGEDAMTEKVCSCITQCFHLGHVGVRYDIASKIQRINRRLDLIAEQKIKYALEEKVVRQRHRRLESTSFDDVVSNLHGRDEIKEAVINSLCGEGDDLKTVSVVGMGGGVGKTALAQLVYSDAAVDRHFDKRIWVCVSDLFDESRVVKSVIISLEGLNHHARYTLDSSSMQNLLERMCESIKGKKFFLVLDDVWADNRQNWDRLIRTFKNGASGSRIMITTRKDTVANMMEYSHMFSLEKLSEEHCWMILSRLAFAGKNEQERRDLEYIGKNIAKRCKGLPLAAKSLGSLLQNKRRREWQKILDSEMWRLDLAQKEIFAPLLLSYYDLPSPIRQCFMYCAVFPKDFDIWAHHLIEHWMAQGFLGLDSDPDLESTGQQYFDFLAARSFFQDFSRAESGAIYCCKMHDIVHDFAQFLTSNDILVKEVYSGGDSKSIDLRRSKKARHLTVMLPEGTCLPTSVHGVKKLRSLVTFSGKQAITAESLRVFSKKAKRLRVLDLNWPDICDHLNESIPKEIGKLIHLRHLNLSISKRLKRLPESLSELINLQSIDLKGCDAVENLPEGIGNMINLRYIRTVGCLSLTYYPKGFGKLTSLRNAEGVIARIDRNDPNEFSLGDMENLNNLQVVILNCEGDAIDDGETRRANFQNKTQLRDFRIDSLAWHLDDRELIQALNLPIDV